jgi:hypothetical protein
MQQTVTRIAFPLSDWRTTSAILRGRNGDRLLPLNLHQIIVNLLHDRVHARIAVFYISRLCSVGTNSVLRSWSISIGLSFYSTQIVQTLCFTITKKGHGTWQAETKTQGRERMGSGFRKGFSHSRIQSRDRSWFCTGCDTHRLSSWLSQPCATYLSCVAPRASDRI